VAAKVDVLVASHGDVTEEKLTLVSSLWDSGIRAECDLRNEIVPLETSDYCLKNSIRFLVLFKKTVYQSSHKVKVKDFEEKKEVDEVLPNVVDMLRRKLSIKQQPLHI